MKSKQNKIEGTKRYVNHVHIKLLYFSCLINDLSHIISTRRTTHCTPLHIPTPFIFDPQLKKSFLSAHSTSGLMTCIPTWICVVIFCQLQNKEKHALRTRKSLVVVHVCRYIQICTMYILWTEIIYVFLLIFVQELEENEGNKGKTKNVPVVDRYFPMVVCMSTPTKILKWPWHLGTHSFDVKMYVY